MQIKRIVVGPLSTNCYVVWSEKTCDAMIIDPGGNFEDIRGVIEKEALAVKYIVNTHGHADHIGANARLKELTGATLAIGAGDAPLLSNPSRNLSVFMADSCTSPDADRLLMDNDVIELDHLLFDVICTPGHSPGGICLYHPGVLFSGDTLFAEGVGRTDLPGGDQQALTESIRSRLMGLPDETVVYPGHGDDTYIGRERRFNPFL